MSGDLLSIAQSLKETPKDNKQLSFPIDFYPEKEQELIHELYESKGLSKQHVGLGMLPVFARIYSKARGISFNNYQISLAFWVAIVDRPGTSKSESLKSWYRELSSHNDYSDPDRYLFYTANDVTPEGLVDNIGETDDGIYLFYDEITRFTGGIGQYKKNQDSDKGFWLGLYSGDIDENQMRVGKLRKMKQQPISVAGTTQPDTLRNAFKDDLTNGFFERFLFSVESNKLPRISENPNMSIGQFINHRIGKHIENPKFNADIVFNKDARQLMHEWYYAKADEFEDDDMKRQFFGKDVIYVNRFAMLTSLLHKDGNPSAISVQDAERALKLYDFCSDMRWKAYKIVTDDETIGQDQWTARAVTQWIGRNYPNFSKDSLGEVFGLSRQMIYKYLE